MNKLKTIYLAGGCFWGVSAFFEKIKGVAKVTSGYANGNIDFPSYNQVCSDTTGFTEAVKVDYYTKETELSKILMAFFAIINPLQKNGQANDIGTQYRTGIYYEDDLDLPIIMNIFKMEQKKYSSPLATEVFPLKNFYQAEEYHQHYLDKNPTGYCHLDIQKALAKLGQDYEK